MLSMYFPSVWRNKKNGKQWQLSWKTACGGAGKPGVEAVCMSDASGKGKIYWKQEGNNTLDFQYIIAQPRRSGLGSILTFAFADTAVDAALARVSIASANPAEHGFYRHMGFDYDAAFLGQLNTITMQSPDPTAMERLWSLVTVEDDDGNEVQIKQALLACELVGDSAHVRTCSHTSAEKTWELVVSN